MTRSSGVYLLVTSTDAVEMMLSNYSLFTGAAWQPYDGGLHPWTLLAGDGGRTVYLSLKDRAGNIERGTVGLDATITVDTTAPLAPVFTIPGGAYSNSRTLELSFGNPTAGETVLFESNRALGVVQEQAAANDLDFTLPDVEGLHLLTLRYRDPAGNVGPGSTASVTLDQVSPSVLHFAVSGGEATSAMSVTLLIEAAGASEMRFSNDGSFWSTWEAYQTMRFGWDIDSGSQGSKSIYLRVRDLAGNEAAAASPATVTYDTQAPTGTLTLAGGQNPVNSRSIEVAIGGYPEDTVGMVVGDAALECAYASYGSFAPAATYTLPVANGSNTVKVCLKDRAGNPGAVSGSIVHDDIVPQLAVTVPERTNDADGTVTVDVTVSGETDPVAITLSSPGALAEISFSADPSGSGSIDLAPSGVSDGDLLLTVEGRDAAGNVATVNRVVVLDRAPPVISAVSIIEDANDLNPGNGFTKYSGITLATTVTGADQICVWGDFVGTPADCDDAVTGWSDYTSSTRSLTLSRNNDYNALHVFFRDRAGNRVEHTTLLGITLDTAVPTACSVVVTGIVYDDSDVAQDSTSLTMTGNVRLAVTAADSLSSIGDVLVANTSSFSGASWRAVDSSPLTIDPWLLAAGSADGVARSVYARCRDRAGNTLDSLAGTIVLDNVAPQSPAVVLAAGDAYTVSYLGVGVELSATGATRAKLSTDPAFGGAPWIGTGTWPFGDTVDFDSAEGAKTVYAKFRDAAGNQSAVDDDSIYYDAEAPDDPSGLVVDGRLSGGKYYVNRITPALSWTESAASDVSGYEVEVAGMAFFTPSTTLVAPALSDGEYGWSVRAVDYANRTSNAVIGTRFVVDTTAPSAPQFEPLSATVIDSASQSVSLITDSGDANFWQYQIRSTASPTWQHKGGTTAYTFDLTADTVNVLRVRALDLAGNASDEDFVIVTEDSQAPAAPGGIDTDSRDGEVQVTWPASTSSDVAGYKLYYGSQPGV
ncbi:MAG: hypothetical protein JXR83_14805, partial [Deltaproteobacteria bacterium]|nr:hypothetical protein [Deltaproteobacteria bacterium]